MDSSILQHQTSPPSLNLSPINSNMSFECFTFVFERLTDLLTGEFKVICTDSEEDIKSLLQGVEIAQILLRDVDQVQRQSDINSELQVKVRQVMSILDEIEDLIDSLYHQGDQRPDQGWARGLVSRASHISNSLKRKRSTLKWAKDLRERLQDAVHCLKRYQLSSESPRFTRRRRLQTHPDIIKEEFIVRFEEDVETYLGQLVAVEAKLSKDLAIFGMGGAGKTTTARVVYNDKRISEHFDKSAWVCVSQDWDKDQLLLQICQQVGVVVVDGKEKLHLKLKKFLLNSSCFFVLDDVWEVEALLELLPVLRSANSGGRTSRVLVTTRNKEIFDFPQHDFSIHKMRPLTQQESWDLFIKTLDRNNSDDSKWYLGVEFVHLGEEMLEKCGGLPLAIVALGGLLSSKTTLHEWETTKKDVVRRIMRQKGGEGDYGVVSEMLELSYFDLPYSLKPCFAYLGIFPEDSDIDVERLIHLWIAEGFIKVDPFFGTDTLEEVAMNYLDELVHRSMVEISEKDDGGDITIIRIHDLIRDLCIRKAKDWRLFEISKPSTSMSTSMAQRSNYSNRIIIHHRDIHVEINNPRLRSYIWLADNRGGLSELNFPSKQMKFLRVLCLQGVDLQMPISDLILLRYLELNESCRVSQESLESIKRLRNLITFICDVQYSEIPDNMVGRMEDLRHLSLPLHSMKESGGGNLGVDNKSKLQVLRASSGEWVTKEMRYVSTGLQELKLTKICSEAQLEAIYDFVSNQCEHLHKLSLWIKFDANSLEFDLHKLKSRHCASLELAGKIRKQEVGGLKFPCRLMKLILMSNQIEEEEQLKEALAELGELRFLVLYGDAYMGDRLSMRGLLKLRRLSLRRLHNLKEWRIEKGALSQLHELVIDECKLGRLPAEIRSIRSLQRIELSDMPKTMFERLKPPSEQGDGEGEDFCLIRHIPFHNI